ncbi:MAG TPA: right-handed parallel beta-helix repeat-containing protein [Thermoanaerobaculia bacterium]
MRGRRGWIVVACCVLAAGAGAVEVDPTRFEATLDAGIEAAGLEEVALGEADGATAGPSGLARARALKARLAAERAPAGARTAAPAKKAKTVTVDCGKGESIQAAIDQNASPIEIEVRGTCQENVEVRGKQVTLRGADPLVDGIQGVTGSTTGAALSILYVDGARIEGLSIGDGPGTGVGMWFSHVTMAGCRIAGNAGTGVHVSSGSFLDARGLTVAENARGLQAQRGGFAFCSGCTFTDNTGSAAVAANGGLLSLLSSVVAGRDGIAANFGSYADIDCVSDPTIVHPCSMTATRRAAFALGDATAALFGAGDFTGQVVANDRAHAFVFGARQTAPGKNPAGNDIPNLVFDFATLWATPFVDEADVVHPSRLMGDTRVEGFSRALLDDGTEIDGQVACSRAGDAWADGVVLTPGSAIVGCEHAPPPAP